MLKLKTEGLSKKVTIGVLYLSGPLFLMLTDPTKLPLPLLVLPFMWLFAALFTSSLWILRQRFGRLPRRRAVISAGIISTLPVMLLVFQSIHQLSIKDVLLTIGFILVASFYLQRADFIR